MCGMNAFTKKTVVIRVKISRCKRSFRDDKPQLIIAQAIRVMAIIAATIGLVLVIAKGKRMSISGMKRA